MSDDDKPRATVREVDGQLVLDDPDAVAVMRAVAKHNCKETLYEGDNADAVERFCRRVEDLGKTPAEVVIVILNVDDPIGGPLADLLMPGNGAMWQAYRDQGMKPIARGLAGREGIQQILPHFDPPAAEKLASIPGLAVVVVDYQAAEVWPVEEV